MNKTKTKMYLATVLTAVLVGLLPVVAAAQQKACPGLGYQTAKCECAAGKACEACPCKPCTANETCVCVEALKANAGAITGTVQVVRTRVKVDGLKSDKSVVVFLEKVGDNAFPPPTARVTVDQKGLVFIPHVTAVLKGTKVNFKNSDNDRHNVYFLNDRTGDTKDLGTWEPRQERDYAFKEEGMAIVLCKLHLEMAAYVFIAGNPYFTTVSIDGETQKASFTIENVPPGTYKLNTWHKTLKLKGGSKEITVEKGGKATIELEITKAKYAK